MYPNTWSHVEVNYQYSEECGWWVGMYLQVQGMEGWLCVNMKNTQFPVSGVGHDVLKRSGKTWEGM